MKEPGTSAFALRHDLGGLERGVTDALQGLIRDRAAERMWQHDASFWTRDPAHVKVVESRLGWLTVLDVMEAQLPQIQAFAEELRAAGFNAALLLGMGGSSLAPEVFRLTFGVKPGYLDLKVLDNTSPEAVQAAAGHFDLRKTVFLVSSKSGTTTEALSFQKFFEARLAAMGVQRPGDQFAAITDPGTPLAELAARKGFRRTFLNPPDIGGRYSALSLFGLVPAALMGVDVARLLRHAAAMARASAPEAPTEDNPGLYLGAAIGAAARQGYDKLTLLTSPTLASLGGWLEQLVAESTGKLGRGVVPVDGEPWADPGAYSPDRLFVSLSLEGESKALEAFTDKLVAAGHPAIRWRLPEREALGAEFFRWEVATAIAGAITEVDPFDEPNVTESKDTTRELLKTRETTGAFPALQVLATGSGISLQADKLWARGLRHAIAAQGFDTGDPASWLAAHLGTAREGDYVALCAYFTHTPPRHERLTELRSLLGTGRPTTLGYGPRFLHSTGQLHKGGANNGIFLQLTAADGADLAIPGEAFTFRSLRDAQALGDLMVLDRRERRALRVHLPAGPDSGLMALEAALVRAVELAGLFLRAFPRRVQP